MTINRIMPSTRIRASRLNNLLRARVRGFTLLESLLVLVISTSLVLLLSSQIQPIFVQVRTQLFFLEFQHLYRESQKLSQVKGESITLNFTGREISNGYEVVSLPAEVVGPDNMQINFDKLGANHSLAKISFRAGDRTVNYQLYLGSGKYKKTED